MTGIDDSPRPARSVHREETEMVRFHTKRLLHRMHSVTSSNEPLEVTFHTLKVVSLWSSLYGVWLQ